MRDYVSITAIGGAQPPPMGSIVAPAYLRIQLNGKEKIFFALPPSQM